VSREVNKSRLEELKNYTSMLLHSLPASQAPPREPSMQSQSFQLSTIYDRPFNSQLSKYTQHTLVGDVDDVESQEKMLSHVYDEPLNRLQSDGSPSPGANPRQSHATGKSTKRNPKPQRNLLKKHKRPAQSSQPQ